MPELVITRRHYLVIRRQRLNKGAAYLNIRLGGFGRSHQEWFIWNRTARRRFGKRNSFHATG